MTISMYQASVPVCIHTLTVIKGLLAKAAAFAEAKKIDPAVMLSLRLSPDMFPLSRQVQIATDLAKGGCARLAGQTAPSYEDTETSFGELQERLDRTVAYLQGLNQADIDGSEAREITLAMRNGQMRFLGPALSAAIRAAERLFPRLGRLPDPAAQRVELGKRDFLGALPTLG